MRHHPESLQDGSRKSRPWRLGRAAVALRREVSAFVLVGSLGFITHAALLALLVRWPGLHPYPAWFPAFAVAVTLTYILNRRWTFRGRAGPDRWREFTRYVLLQGLGAVVNNAVYALALWLHPLLRAEPVLALAAGSLVAMVVNYAGARQLAFKGGGVRRGRSEPG